MADLTSVFKCARVIGQGDTLLSRTRPDQIADHDQPSGNADADLQGSV